MSNLESTNLFKVPEPTLRRLPWYLALCSATFKGRRIVFILYSDCEKYCRRRIDGSQGFILRANFGSHPCWL